MKKVVFIIPYFGQFNNYFQLFLNSCERNQKYTWIIFTDDKRDFQYPNNVLVNYMEMKELKSIIERKLGFEISLDRGYKLCDYKPAYGYIFEDYIKDYDFWGHCDTDLIFGNLSKYIENIDIDKYDKVFFLGHCTLYKNNIENNRRFMLELHGKNRYEEVFKSKEICAFDEQYKGSINDIYDIYNFPTLNKEYEANIYTKSAYFKLTNYDFSKMKYIINKKENAFFVWDNGEIYRYIYKNGQIIKNEYMYIHLQLRKMQIKLNNLNIERYKIIPNQFEEIEFEEINKDNFSKIKKNKFNLQYFKVRFHGLLKRINRVFYK
ncbi:MAG: hypothetical protein HFJ52_04310 [Clostridia bacterium]|nr:hypothetical protein [Clostridia bacterium]